MVENSINWIILPPYGKTKKQTNKQTKKQTQQKMKKYKFREGERGENSICRPHKENSRDDDEEESRRKNKKELGSIFPRDAHNIFIC